MFCQCLLYSKVTQSCIYGYLHSFSHIILPHVPSQVIRYSSLRCSADLISGRGGGQNKKKKKSHWKKIILAHSVLIQPIKIATDICITPSPRFSNGRSHVICLLPPTSPHQAEHLPLPKGPHFQERTLRSAVSKGRENLSHCLAKACSSRGSSVMEKDLLRSSYTL